MVDISLYSLVLSLGVFYFVNVVIGLICYFILNNSMFGFIIGMTISSVILIIMIPSILGLI